MLWFYAHCVTPALEKIATSNTSEINQELTFEYKNEVIKTSDSLQFVYHGYKYLILTKPEGGIVLYPTNEIGRIEYHEK